MAPQSHSIFSMIWPQIPNQVDFSTLFTLCLMLWNSKLSPSPPCSPPFWLGSQHWGLSLTSIQSRLTAGLRPPPGSHCTISPQSAVQLQSPATIPGVHPQTEQAYRHSGWVLVISATWSQCVCESNTITLLKSPDLMVQHGVHIPYKLPNSQSPGLGMQRYFPTFDRSFWPLKVINILGYFVPNSLLWTMSKRQHMELINKRWKGQCGRPLSPKKEQTKVGGNVSPLPDWAPLAKGLTLSTESNFMTRRFPSETSLRLLDSSCPS